jgi:hypothetical protein
MSESDLKFDRRKMKVIIASYCKKSLCAQDSHMGIISVLGESKVSGSTVRNWYAELRGGRRSFQDDPESGHSREVTTDEFVSTVKELVRGDPNTAIR